MQTSHICGFHTHSYTTSGWTTGDFGPGRAELMAGRRLSRACLAETTREWLRPLDTNQEWNVIPLPLSTETMGRLVPTYLALKGVQGTGRRNGWSVVATSIHGGTHAGPLASVVLAAALVRQDAERQPPEPPGVPPLRLVLDVGAHAAMEFFNVVVDVDRDEAESLTVGQWLQVFRFVARQHACRRPIEGGHKRCGPALPSLDRSVRSRQPSIASSTQRIASATASRSPTTGPGRKYLLVDIERRPTEEVSVPDYEHPKGEKEQAWFLMSSSKPPTPSMRKRDDITEHNGEDELTHGDIALEMFGDRTSDDVSVNSEDDDPTRDDVSVNSEDDDLTRYDVSVKSEDDDPPMMEDESRLNLETIELSSRDRSFRVSLEHFTIYAVNDPPPGVDHTMCLAILQTIAGKLWGDTVLYLSHERPTAVRSEGKDMRFDHILRTSPHYKHSWKDIFIQKHRLNIEQLILELDPDVRKRSNSDTLRYLEWRSDIMENILNFLMDYGVNNLQHRETLRVDARRPDRTMFRAELGRALFLLVDEYIQRLYETRPTKPTTSFLQGENATIRNVAHLYQELAKNTSERTVFLVWNSLTKACEAFQNFLPETDPMHMLYIIMKQIPDRARAVERSAPQYLKRLDDRVRRLLRIGETHWKNQTALLEALQPTSQVTPDAIDRLNRLRVTSPSTTRVDPHTDYTHAAVVYVVEHILTYYKEHAKQSPHVEATTETREQSLEQYMNQLKKYCNDTSIHDSFKTMLEEMYSRQSESVPSKNPSEQSRPWGQPTKKAREFNHLFFEYFLGPSPSIQPYKNVVTWLFTLKRFLEELNVYFMVPTGTDTEGASSCRDEIESISPKLVFICVLPLQKTRFIPSNVLF